MKNYQFIDSATQIYVAVVGALILVFHGHSVARWPLLVGAHAACLLLVHGLIRVHAAGRGGRVVDFLRSFYPILLYTGFYRETGALNQMFCSGYLDVVLLRLEARLLGGQPSLTFMERFPSRVASEFFYASYFSYYLMIVGIGLALFIRNRGQFFHYLSVVSFVFYCCYLTYIFLPVMGPRIFFVENASPLFGGQVLADLPAELLPEPPPEFPACVQAGLFYRLVILIYEHFEAPGAAFPSSHVAIALTTLYFSWLYLKRIRWLHAFVAVALCVSTVYCRYHYVVDVAAGAAVAVALVPLANRLFLRFQKILPGVENERPRAAG